MILILKNSALPVLPNPILQSFRRLLPEYKFQINFQICWPKKKTLAEKEEPETVAPSSPVQEQETEVDTVDMQRKKIIALQKSVWKIYAEERMYKTENELPFQVSHETKITSKKLLVAAI